MTRGDYPNTLHFGLHDIEGLLTYLQYKFASMRDWPESEPELCSLAAGELQRRITADGGLIALDKTDAVFWAAAPRGRGRR